MSPASTRLAKASRSMSHAYRSKRREEALAEEADVEAERARRITSLAMRTADMMLSSGASAARTTNLVLQICRFYQLPAQVDITYTRILISYEPSAASDPITVMRTVKPGGVDYDRLTRIENLIERIRSVGLPVELASDRLRHIRAEPRTYRPWVLYGAAATLGGGVAQLLGGNQADVLLAMLATFLVELVRTGLSHHGVNTFFSTTVAASMPAIIGLGVMVARPVLPSGLLLASPSLIVAAGMVSLLAGLGVVTAAGDAIDGYYMSAGTRIVEVCVLTAGIVLGLITTLWIGLVMGVPAYLAPGEGFSTTPAVQIACAGVISACFGVLCNMGPRAALVSILAGMLVQSCFLTLRGISESAPACAGLAAVVMGLLARTLTRSLRIPMVALLTTSLAPLMPGLTLYRGIFAMIASLPSTPGIPTDGDDPSTLLLQCALTGAALAAGSSFGASMAGVVIKTLRKGINRRRRPKGAMDQPLEGPQQPIFTVS